jgi:hypothetical protein
MIPHRFQTLQFRGCAGCESSVASSKTSIPSTDPTSYMESFIGLTGGLSATGFFSSSITTGGVLLSSMVPVYNDEGDSGSERAWQLSLIYENSISPRF